MRSVHVPRARSTSECPHSSRVNSDAVILVIAIRTGNNNIGRAPNVEAVGVLALAVTGRVVDSHAGNGKPVRTIDADGLDGRVLDVQVGDGRAGKVMRVKELGLRHAARATLAIPVLGTTTVEDGTGCSLDGNGLALDLQERSVPLFVTPGCRTLEDDLSWLAYCLHIIK